MRGPLARVSVKNSGENAEVAERQMRLGVVEMDNFDCCLRGPCAIEIKPKIMGRLIVNELRTGRCRHGTRGADKFAAVERRSHSKIRKLEDQQVPACSIVAVDLIRLFEIGDRIEANHSMQRCARTKRVLDIKFIRLREVASQCIVSIIAAKACAGCIQRTDNVVASSAC